MTKSHIIFLKGRDKTHEIAHCELIGEKLLVRFKSSPKVFTYTKPNFAIFPKATDSEVFCYLQSLATILRLPSDEGENAIALLAKEYSKITHIPDSCALFEYLNPTHTAPTPHEQSQHSPILAPFGLNLSQSQALHNALEHKISVIEGPPGTGKTQTILNLIANLLYQNKTIAVLSNNNAATQNVYEKLKAYGFGYLCATLGKKENKEQFLQNQSSIYPAFDTQPLDTQEVEQTIAQSHQSLYEIFTLQNSIATHSAELETLQLEYQYFRESHNVISPKIRTLFAKPTPHTILMLKVALEEDTGTKISLYQKLKAVYLYGVGDLRFYTLPKQEILKALESLYYTISITTLERTLRDFKTILHDLQTQKPLQTLQEHSLALLKHHLGLHYAHNAKRPIFSLQDLYYKPQEFLQQYPIVFSTTHSITSSLGSMSDNPLFDYVIVDEASQVDLVSGALALLCAKNAVIVGDTKQLPNVIDKDTQRHIQALKFNILESYDYTKHSLLSSIKAVLDSAPKVLLREHYRCHPSIIGFCNKRFYNNELIILSKATSHTDAIKAYITPTGNHARGTYNQREIDVIEKEILPSLDFAKKEIGIITPYNEQKQHLQSTFTDIEADTIHKYQGREKEAIILTTAANVSNDFINDSKILNVAISRAKSVLRIVTSEQIAHSHTIIGDFIKYIRYENFEVAQSGVKSIFDLLYKANRQARLAYLKGKKKISQFDSENLAFSVIQEALAPYPVLDVLTHIPLYRILNDTHLLDEAQRRYALNPRTHIDFLIYNTMDKSPIAAIEVDGFAFHHKATRQAQNDRLKDSILDKCGLPLLRLSTIGSGEQIRIQAFLQNLGYG